MGVSEPSLGGLSRRASPSADLNAGTPFVGEAAPLPRQASQNQPPPQIQLRLGSSCNQPRPFSMLASLEAAPSPLWGTLPRRTRGGGRAGMSAGVGTVAQFDRLRKRCSSIPGGCGRWRLSGGERGLSRPVSGGGGVSSSGTAQNSGLCDSSGLA